MRLICKFEPYISAWRFIVTDGESTYCYNVRYCWGDFIRSKLGRITIHLLGLNKDDFIHRRKFEKVVEVDDIVCKLLSMLRRKRFRELFYKVARAKNIDVTSCSLEEYKELYRLTLALYSNDILRSKFFAGLVDIDDVEVEIIAGL